MTEKKTNDSLSYDRNDKWKSKFYTLQNQQITNDSLSFDRKNPKYDSLKFWEKKQKTVRDWKYKGQSVLAEKQMQSKYWQKNKRDKKNQTQPFALKKQRAVSKIWQKKLIAEKPNENLCFDTEKLRNSPMR